MPNLNRVAAVTLACAPVLPLYSSVTPASSGPDTST
jgi:hypothetical protein